MANYNTMGDNALTMLITLVKQALDKCVKTADGKGLSENDFTNALKEAYDAHIAAAHAPANAQENILENVKVNGVALSVTSKSVDIPVPLISTDIVADQSMDTKAASAKAVYSYVSQMIGGQMQFKICSESEYNADGIPTVSGQANTIYMVPLTGSANNAYKEFIFVNNKYEQIGTTEVDLSGYLQKSEISEYSADEVSAIWTQVFNA